MSHSTLQKVIIPQLVTDLPSFYGNCGLATVHTSVQHRSAFSPTLLAYVFTVPFVKMSSLRVLSKWRLLILTPPPAFIAFPIPLRYAIWSGQLTLSPNIPVSTLFSVFSLTLLLRPSCMMTDQTA